MPTPCCRRSSSRSTRECAIPEPMPMTQPLTFLMGNFAAEFPTDRRYAKNHMWGQRREGCIRFGFTAYAVRLLQDVYFLDWTVAAGAKLTERQEIGSIESKKAESSLYAPLPGVLSG